MTKDRNSNIPSIRPVLSDIKFWAENKPENLAEGLKA